jgi:hypothetical protein
MRSSFTLFDLKQPNPALIQTTNTISTPTTPTSTKYKGETRNIVKLVDSEPFVPYDVSPLYTNNAPASEYYSRLSQTASSYSYLFGESNNTQQLSQFPLNLSTNILPSTSRLNQDEVDVKDELISRFSTLNLGTK